MKYKIYLFALLFMVSTNTFSQVGIGNPNPDSTSVLDLSNPNNKGLILPEAKTLSEMSTSEGMMYFFEDNIYIKRTDGYNSLSPWKFKFNGDISNHLFFNLNGNVGIGSTDITVSPEAPLHIETDKPVSLTENGTILLGRSDAENLIINSNEIQTRNAGAAADLVINEDGGDVSLGSKNKPANLKISGKSKGLMVDSNSYYDYMPTGAICMWSGTPSNIPLGWGLCDGTSYPTSINSNDSIISPDLSGRFIVTVGDNGVHSYSPGDTGGQDRVLITIETMPNHQHNSRDLGHGHSYSYQRLSTSTKGRGAPGRYISGGKSSKTGTSGSAVVTLAQNSVGGNSPHENRPSYYVLAFIIKL